MWLQLLNAKPENVERESETVAQSGRSGAVTIATNMAGRGTDIILGGNPGDINAAGRQPDRGRERARPRVNDEGTGLMHPALHLLDHHAETALATVATLAHVDIRSCCCFFQL